MWGALADESAAQIVSAVVIAILAFALGTFRRTIVRRVRTRQTRKYWKSFRARGVAIVVGAFSPEDLLSSASNGPGETAVVASFEPYGFVGFGEVFAASALQEHLKVLGLENIVVAHAAQVSSFANRNLVILGGPDSNTVTELAMRRADLPVEFEEIGPRTRMRVRFAGGEGSDSASKETTYDPIFRAGEPEKLTEDYGFVAQVTSPFSPECRAVLLVGVYGAAISAAAQLVTSPYGVTRLLRVNDGECLAVFRTFVGRNGAISSPRLEALTPLLPAPEPEEINSASAS